MISITPKLLETQPSWNTSKPTCHICFKTGHTANVCWKLAEFKASSAYRPPPIRNPRSAYLANMDGPSNNNWYLDSGATHHLTNDVSNMHINEAYTGTVKLFVGNGVSLCIIHIGYTVLKLKNSITFPTFKLNNILFIPQITKNLINISQLTKDNNIIVEFTNKFYFMKDKVKNLIMLQGKAEKGLYKLLLVSSKTIIPSTTFQSHVAGVELVASETPLSMFFVVEYDVKNKTSCLPSATNDCVNSKCLLSIFVLHQRFGHLNSRILTHVIQSCSSFKFVNKNKVNDSYDACKVGKMHKLHFPASETKTNHSLEIIHTDLWRPILVISVQGYRYYVSFVDEYTRFTWIFPLKTKDKKLFVFKIFKTQVEKQFKRSIKCLQFD